MTKPDEFVLVLPGREITIVRELASGMSNKIYIDEESLEGSGYHAQPQNPIQARSQNPVIFYDNYWAEYEPKVTSQTRI